VLVLAFWQPLARGWARYSTWLKFKQNAAVRRRHDLREKESWTRIFRMGNHVYWNEAGQGREALLKELIQTLEDEDWRYSWDTGWKDWDVQFYGNYWWQIKMQTVTEYHGGPRR